MIYVKKNITIHVSHNIITTDLWWHVWNNIAENINEAFDIAHAVNTAIRVYDDR
jgi:hypothetical protein